MGNLEDADTIANFNVELARESENIILDPETVNKGVHALLENPQYGFYVVAERDGIILGSLMITYEFSDWRNGVIWWVLGALIMMPLALGMNQMVFAIGQPQVMSLVGHLVYGLVTAYVFNRLYGRA